MRLFAAAALVMLAAACASASAKSDGFTKLVDGLQAPTDVRAAPGDASTLYVVEQPGTIKKIVGGKVTSTFLDIRRKIKSGGEQGLLSMVFDPGYAQNHTFYVSYTDTNGDSRVARYRSANGVGVPSSEKQLLFVDQPYDNHNGGELQFNRGYLYFGLGDGGSGGDPEQRAQNMGTKLGKLLRLNPSRGGWQIVALGLRNPWRFSFDAKDNLWIGDVGQNKYEEIDFRAATRVGRLANYGWSRYEGRSSFDSSHALTRRGDLVFPVAIYSHPEHCSVTGGYVVGGRYYYGDFCSGQIWSFRAGNGRLSAPVTSGKVPSLSSFGVGGDGALYATSLEGALYKLTG